jgi:hypothetical protein
VNDAPKTRRPAPLALLWLLVLIEFLSPVPAFLTLGAVWVLLARPPWFFELVRALYSETEGGGGGTARD